MKEIFAIIIDKDPTSNEITKRFLDENSKIKRVEQFLNIEDGYNFACKEMPDLIFIDIAYGEDLVFETVSKIRKDNKVCKIIISAKEISANNQIKAIKMGAREFLIKPFIKKDFDAVITKVVNEINYKSNNVNSKIISVFSNKGGIGKTTIATNLALEINDLENEPTVIVDFNSQFGDISTFLDVKADFGMSYLLKNKSEIDKDFLLTSLPRYRDSELYVLTDIFSLNDVSDISLENVQDIIDALKSAFKYIVIDMTNLFDLKTIKILDNSDDILFPLVANIPNLKNCARCLEFFEKIGYDENKIKLILNRVSENDEIKIDDIEDTLRKKIYAKLYNDYFVVMAAINRGIGISSIDRESSIAKSIQSLAFKLIRDEEN